MIHRILVTAIYKWEHASQTRGYYFGSEDSGRVFYCDALSPTEACCKYMLRSHEIDTIAVLNSGGSTADEAMKPVPLRDGKSFYTSDISRLSVFDLLRYRLAEYLDDLNAEHLDDSSLLSEAESAEAAAFLRAFHKEKSARTAASASAGSSTSWPRTRPSGAPSSTRCGPG